MQPDRGISKVGSGMAIASNWMSAASFLGMAALMYGSGYHGLAYVVGWTGGYVLLLILMAGQIRKYGKYTAADFIGDRYYSKTLRAVGAIIAILISISYCVGQFGGIGLMFKWVMGIDYSLAVIIGGAVVLTYTLISGMLGVTKNMQIQYVIIIISFLIPLFILTAKFDYFWLLPQIGYGSVVSDAISGLPINETKELVNSLGHDFAIVPVTGICHALGSSHRTNLLPMDRHCLFPDDRNCRSSPCDPAVLCGSQGQGCHGGQLYGDCSLSAFSTGVPRPMQHLVRFFQHIPKWVRWPKMPLLSIPPSWEIFIR